MTKQCECGCFVPTRCHGCGEPLAGMSNDDLALRLAEAECKQHIESIEHYRAELATLRAENKRRGETIERYRVALAAMQCRQNQAVGLIDWFVQECGGPYNAAAYSVTMLAIWWGWAVAAGALWGALGW